MSARISAGVDDCPRSLLYNRKYTECSIVKALASFIYFKVGVSLGHGFVSVLVMLDSVPTKKNNV